MARRATTFVAILGWLAASATYAQTTAFTHQGRLNDGGVPANGLYDFQFTLWDALTAGTQQGSPNTVTVSGVAVTGGVFTVQLDFGATGFPGADRFLEMNVRPNGGGAFTLLMPRQKLTSAPYAIRAISAASADATSFAGVTTGTNATALHVGTGGSLNATGSGTIAATSAPASGLTGSTLAAGVTGSSLTSVGTLGNLTVTNPISGSVTGSSGSTTGNAATATALQTARTINGVAFNGTSNITLPGSGGGTLHFSFSVNPASPGTQFSSFAGSNVNAAAAANDLNTFILPSPATFDACTMALYLSQFSGVDTITVWLAKNGVATSLTATATSNATTGVRSSATCTGGPVSFAAGDTISWKLQNTNSTPVVLVRLVTHAQ